ncbi:translation initiation factor IF-2-like isoform X2 [Homarus americanus]|uniref:translation initiation factor IF-2-like isoform X2 n=1 Tax=Homarus americanus TaxID=6706 RepID=UPI001C44A2D3|nr:translation initiation factor IF-2-like isoform X2 [Homarus americanus]
MDSDEKEYLDCPICLEQYDEGLRTPKMMPCLHTFCASCLVELISPSTSQQKSNVIPSSEIYNLAPAPAAGTRPTNPIRGLYSLLGRGSTQVLSSQEHDNHVYDDPTPQQEDVPSSNSSKYDQRRHSNVSAITNTLQNNRAHPTLRRMSGHGPSTTLTRHPCDPLPCTPTVPTTRPLSFPTPIPRHAPTPPPLPSPTSPPALPARNSGQGGPPAPERPQKKPNIPPLKPKPAVIDQKEPKIPRNEVVQCPLCRTLINTSQLQTNRYVVAHLRDLARLEILRKPEKQSELLATTKPPNKAVPPSIAPDLKVEEFWCITCDVPARDHCTSHELSPIQQWVETLGVSLAELQRRVERRINTYSSYLDSTDEDVKVVFTSLNKASRHLWKSRQEVQEVKDQLCDGADEPANNDPRQRAIALSHRMTSLRALEEQVGIMEMGAESNEVYIYRQNNKLYVSTCQPDRTIIITINQGMSQV